MIFIFLGALPILIAVGLGYRGLWVKRNPASAVRPAAAE